MKTKLVTAINDISCMGRCSLTVALPVLSAAGIETAVIPTALLSTHTGGFEGYTYLDLSEQMPVIAEHWKTLGRKNDAFYTGYLSNESQIDTVKTVMDMLTDSDTLIFTDPVMGDNGRLYASFEKSFPEKMKSLVAISDIITPNLTEACLLTDTEYKTVYGREYIEEIAKKLTDIGAKRVYITGISLKKGTLGVLCKDKKSEESSYIFSEKLEGMFHGAGDVFASALLGALLNGKDDSQACRIALDYTADCIRRTARESTDTRFGLLFEQGLKNYADTVSE